MDIINGLWIGGRLSSLELLCIHSFLSKGYTFHLWVYEDVLGIPSGVIVQDANEIIAKKDVFTYIHVNKFGHGKGSYAGFSDIFRYKLLYEKGGCWVDMDITCLQPIDADSTYLFRYNKHLGVVGNFIRVPKNSELMEYCYNRSIKQVNADNRDWILPIQILKDGIDKFGLNDSIRNFSNDDSFPIVSALIRNEVKIPKNWQVIHWMNEEWRRFNLDKDTFIKGSTIDIILNQYKIAHSNYTFFDECILKIRISNFYYTLVSVLYLIKSNFKKLTKFILNKE